MYNVVLFSAADYTWVIWVVVGVLLVGMLIFNMWSSRKRGKQMNDMHTTLRVGDEIMTIGGILGTVVELRERSATDKDFVIETGSGDNKTSMLLDMRALYENRTRMREVQAEAARQAELQRLKKEADKIEAPQEENTVGTEAEIAEPADESKE